MPPSEMKRVLTNIINNACEAVLPKDGIVNVCIKRENGYIIITIDDNGPGISKEIQDSLFTRGVTTKIKVQDLDSIMPEKV
ncbi:MAG: ATP-binding protein [Coxiellaceae bacterium]|nr:MAG: ATP-binding protein [Coxiellaceae bacterium]